MAVPAILTFSYGMDVFRGAITIAEGQDTTPQPWLDPTVQQGAAAHRALEGEGEAGVLADADHGEVGAAAVAAAVTAGRETSQKTCGEQFISVTLTSRYEAALTGFRCKA